MKKRLFTLFCLMLGVLLTVGLASCDESNTPNEDGMPPATCQHRDADDNFLCDKCSESYTDGTDVTPPATCQHRDANDDSLCDKCSESYTDGTDVTPPAVCQHRDADDNSLCDTCGESYTDGIDIEPPVHTHTEVTDAAVAPTDTADGLTEGKRCSTCGEVLVKQEVVPALLQGTAIKSQLLTVNGDQITATFSNATEIFFFVNDITVAKDATYVVARDSNCEQPIASQIVALTAGDNVYYILVTNGDAQKLYTVTVRRRPMYTVFFATNGGTAVEVQTVEEGRLAAEPTTTRTGYTFAGWDHDFTTPIMGNTRITASWTPHTNIAYKAEYYLQNLNDNDYTLIDDKTENLTGTAGAQVTAEQKTFEHFTLNTYMSTLSGNVNGDGSLVLKVYYTRNRYTISNANTSYGSITSAGSHKYGASVTATATEHIGCEFLGWYSGNERISTDATYTFTAEKNVEARFDVKAEMANFNLTSTATTCTITSLKDKTITKIVVPDYVTSISQGAFSACSSLESITLPFVKTTAGKTSYPFGYIFGTSSYTGGVATTQDDHNTSTNFLTSRGYYIPATLKSVTITGGNIHFGAFQNCSGLTSITIPESVTSIGSRAFEGCSGLTSITIPESVTSIGFEAFEGCSGLTSITIPESVTFVGSSAFSGCSGGLESITVASGNTQYHSAGNCLIETVSKILVLGCKNSVIPTDGTVTSIGDDAFYGCSELTSITIPESVTSIGDYAFQGCSGLTSITIGNGVTSIGSYAFDDCYKLIEVYNLSTLNVTAGSDDHGYVAYCAKNVYTATAEQSKLFTDENGYIFYDDGTNRYLMGYTGTDTVLTLPASCKGNNYEIYRYAFYERDDITSVTIPEGVTSIGNGAFYGCNGLTSITIPESVTSIGYSAFKGCSGLTSITIPNSVTSIGFRAFYNCSGLTSITIPESVTSIGEDAFTYCRSLTSITITDGVTSIGDDAFWGCSGLTSVTIPNSVTSIGSRAFYSCSGLESITVASGNTVYHSTDNCLIETASKTLVLGCKNSVIPTDGSVTSIGDYAFYGCSGLTSVTIGSGVTRIGSYAFYGCSGLTSITIPSSVTMIGWGAFAFCSGLTSITIPNSVTRIGSYAFYGCSSLNTVYYTGTANQWFAISVDSMNGNLTSATRYYYSAEKPTTGNYWYYNENGEVTVW